MLDGVGYRILISIDFYDFISPFSSVLVLVSIEKIYQTLKTVFDHIFFFLFIYLFLFFYNTYTYINYYSKTATYSTYSTTLLFFF